MKATMKKLVSAMLAMMMVLTMCVGMSATQVEAASGSYTITISNTETGHTYEAYQIFAGDLSDGKLSNIVWGDGANTTDEDTLMNAIKAIKDASDGTPFSSCTDAASVADVLATYDDDEAVVEAFADVISGYLNTTSGTFSSEDGYKISGVGAGYYLVKDKDNSLSGNKAYTDYILEVVADVTVTAKSSVPTVEKKVEEKNDTTGVTAGWQDAADYDIKDSINYKLTGTLPETLDDYSVYYYVFTDTLSKGLTFNKAGETVAASDVTVTVYANDDKTGTVVASGYTVSLADYTGTGDAYEGGTVLTVTIADVYKLQAESASADEYIAVTKTSKIVVTYSATLNSDANIGSTGNPNQVVLIYSNNPNNAGSGETGTTPEDKVTVFTYKVTVNKVKNIENTTENESGSEYTTEGTTELEGAGFTLYKKNSSGSYVQVGEEVTDTAALI